MPQDSCSPPNRVQEIPDPSDVKPADWVDEAMMVDPDDKQPEDWDERQMVEDAEATKPEGWMDDEPEYIADPSESRACCVALRYSFTTVDNILESRQHP